MRAVNVVGYRLVYESRCRLDAGAMPGHSNAGSDCLLESDPVASSEVRVLLLRQLMLITQGSRLRGVKFCPSPLT